MRACISHRRKRYADNIAIISRGLAMLLIISSSLPADGLNYVISNVSPNNNYRADCVGGGLACLDTLKEQLGTSLTMGQAMDTAAQAGQVAAANVWGTESTMQLKYGSSSSELNAAGLSNILPTSSAGSNGSTSNTSGSNISNAFLKAGDQGAITLPTHIIGVETLPRYYCSGPTQSGVADAGAIVALYSQADCYLQTNECHLVSAGDSPDDFTCNYIGTRTDADAQSLALQILNNSNPGALLGYTLPIGDSLELQYDSGGSGQIKKIIESSPTGISKTWNVYGGQYAQLQQWNLNGVWLERATNAPSVPGYLKSLVQSYGMDATALTSILQQNKAVFVELTNGPGSKLDGNVWSTTNEWGINNQATQRVFAQQPVLFWNAKLREPLTNQVIYDLGPYSRETAYGGGLKLIQSPVNTAGQTDKTAFGVVRQGNQFFVDIQAGQHFYVKDPGAILQASAYPGGTVPHTPGYFTSSKAFDGNLQFVSKGGTWIVDASGTPHSLNVNLTYQQQGGNASQGSGSALGVFDHVDPRTGSGVYKLAIARSDNAILKLCVDETGNIDGGTSQQSGNGSLLSSRVSNFQNDPTAQNNPLNNNLVFQGLVGEAGRQAISAIPNLALRGAASATWTAFGYEALLGASQGTLSGPDELAFEARARNVMSCH
jgi:hypothetical protein